MTRITESIAKLMWRIRQEELCKVSEEGVNPILWEDASDELQDIYKKMADEILKEYIIIVPKQC